MYQETMELIKRILKRTYERYIGERKDKTATLSDIATLFNIPIDETRINDYTINNISYISPSIEIKDEKNDIIYTATYTDDTDLLDYIGAKELNSVVSVSPLWKKEVLYYIGSKVPIITRITFTKGEYDLVFERETASSTGILANNGTRIAVRYFQNIVYNGKNVKQPLLNKIYTDTYKDEVYDGAFEQIYTYGPDQFIEYSTSQNKYTYTKNNNVIYGINNLEQKGILRYLRGICFESTDIPLRDYFPLNMYIKNYPLLSENNTQSAMILSFKTKDGLHHSFQAYKGKEKINGIYYSERYPDEEKIINEVYELPNLSEGTITSEEIQKILSLLQTRIKENTILDIISNELHAFSKKINIRKGIQQEEFDPLSPKRFIDTSFDEICALMEANGEDYFKLISEQFKIAGNRINEKDKIKSKIFN